MIPRKSILKVGYDTLGAINCPKGYCFMVNFAHKLYH